MLEFLNQGLAKITAEADGNDISFVGIWSLTKVLAFILWEPQMSVPSSEPNHQVDIERFYWINTHFILVVVPQEMSEDHQTHSQIHSRSAKTWLLFMLVWMEGQADSDKFRD